MSKFKRLCIQLGSKLSGNDIEEAIRLKEDHERRMELEKIGYYAKTHITTWGAQYKHPCDIVMSGKYKETMKQMDRLDAYLKENNNILNI